MLRTSARRLAARETPSIHREATRYLSSRHLPGSDAERFCEQAIRDKRTIITPWVTRDENVLRLTQDYFPSEAKTFALFESTDPPKRKALKISRLNGSMYRNESGPKKVVYAGGPGSMVGTVINAVKARENNENEEITYMARDTADANYLWSGYNYHEHIACGLNEDHRFRGHGMLKETFPRFFHSAEKQVKDAKKYNYRCVDVSLGDIFNAHVVDNIKLMIKMELHTLGNMYKIRKTHFGNTDWYHDRKYAAGTKTVLREVDRWMEKYLSSGAPEDKLLPGLNSAKPSLADNFDTSWSIALVPSVAEELEKLYKMVDQHLGIPYKHVPRPLINDVFGSNGRYVKSAFHHPHGSRVATDFHHQYEDLVKHLGHKWTYGTEIQKVFVDDEGVAGIETVDKSGIVDFQQVDKLVLSLGYSCRLEYDTSDMPLLQRLLRSKKATDHIMTGTGVSGYLLLSGRIPTLECNINHITPIAYNEEADLTLVKITVGGNVASRGVKGTYLIHILTLCRRLFGDRVQGVISFKPCPRSINYRNFTKFFRLAPNFIVSEGHGGTGMTSQGVNGALSYLLTHPNASRSDLFEDVPDFMGDVRLGRLFEDRSERTRRALGLGKPTYDDAEVVA